MRQNYDSRLSFDSLLLFQRNTNLDVIIQAWRVCCFYYTLAVEKFLWHKWADRFFLPIINTIWQTKWCSWSKKQNTLKSIKSLLWGITLAFVSLNLKWTTIVGILNPMYRALGSMKKAFLLPLFFITVHHSKAI